MQNVFTRKTHNTRMDTTSGSAWVPGGNRLGKTGFGKTGNKFGGSDSFQNTTSGSLAKLNNIHQKKKSTSFFSAIPNSSNYYVDPKCSNKRSDRNYMITTFGDSQFVEFNKMGSGFIPRAKLIEAKITETEELQRKKEIDKQKEELMKNEPGMSMVRFQRTNINQDAFPKLDQLSISQQRGNATSPTD